MNFTSLLLLDCGLDFEAVRSLLTGTAPRRAGWA